MFHFLSSFPAALVMCAAAAGFFLTVRVNHRLQRRRFLMRHADPCRRCGARN
jgi:hypothetical protein